MKFILSNFLILSILVSCGRNKIENASTLNVKDINLLISLKLLDKNEKLQQFYTEYRKDLAGNFYSDKRLASYWIDENDSMNNKLEFAYYEDISKIDTVYNAGVTYCPYLLVTRNDNTSFKVCVEGSRKQIGEFFNGAINYWEVKNK